MVTIYSWLVPFWQHSQYSVDMQKQVVVLELCCILQLCPLFILKQNSEFCLVVKYLPRDHVAVQYTAVQLILDTMPFAKQLYALNGFFLLFPCHWKLTNSKKGSLRLPNLGICWYNSLLVPDISLNQGLPSGFLVFSHTICAWMC